jgi:secreted trypsin-like serine protease
MILQLFDLQGDSGGPLNYDTGSNKYEVVGVTSFGSM